VGTLTLFLSTQKQTGDGLCKAVLWWTSENEGSRREDFSVLFPMVNLNHLSPELLKDLYYKEVRYITLFGIISSKGHKYTEHYFLSNLLQFMIVQRNTANGRATSRYLSFGPTEAFP